ncbi:phosphoribosylanthranilate isomerase [Methanothermobacter sp. K4]|uniref:phosphoribosylanthranilate isomerase n=1 Tax=Methanothermobacter sp. K4 TaxID=2913262 RepID=UPI001EDAEF83|nr:phosphoribosylanthranilate isomerase [Methanothermobacter sp. K4]MCG2827679.1 phosphoribosylanthranilate isomerase [Methanothermobacter sp. K4]
MKIKICGLTREEDVVLADSLGADLLGFIHAQRSPRHLELGDVAELSSIIPDEKAVLVIETSETAKIMEAIDETGIERIQLHSVSPEVAGRISRSLHEEGYNLELTLAIPPVSSYISGHEFQGISGLLLDSTSGGKTGGTGKIIAPSDALELLALIRGMDPSLRVTLAGGLTLEFVRKNMDYVSKFDCLDFNSGLETEPGLKDHEMMAELMNYIEGLPFRKGVIEEI